MFMDGKAVAQHLDMSKTISDAGQLAYSLTKTCVSALVLLLGACRNTNEHHISNLLAKLLLQMVGCHLSHLLVSIIPGVFECPDEISRCHCILANVLDTDGEILQEVNHLLA